MNPRRNLRLSILLLAASLVLPVLAASKSELEAAVSIDGLEKIKVKGLDLAYARPGASLASYNRVKVDPVEVAFDTAWDPKRTGSSFKLDAKEREAIRSGTATIVRDEFIKALQAKSGYQVTEESGPDVLRVKTRIVDLYVNAPDTMSPGITRTYTLSAGRMTLVAELYDSESGQVLARVADQREARNTGQMQLTNRATNEWAASDVAAGWARLLRNALDKAHGIGKK
jgi:hypothetical protein